MFGFIKNIFDNRGKKKENVTKPMIVCIHGFGKRRNDEYLNFLKEFSEDYEIVIPYLFNQEDPEDTKWEDWFARGEEPVKRNPERDIILIGYSMGGVIASHIAMKNPNVKRLILLEPAFDWLSVKTLKTTAAQVIKKNPDDFPEYTSLPNNYYETFREVVGNLKNSIVHVECPTLFIHCIDDEMIPWSVSNKAFKKMKNKDKRLVCLGGGRHRVMDDEVLYPYVFHLIREVINDFEKEKQEQK